MGQSECNVMTIQRVLFLENYGTLLVCIMVWNKVLK